MAKAAALAVEQVEATTVGPDPQPPLRIFEHRGHAVGREAGRIGGIVRQPGHQTRARVETVEAAISEIARSDYGLQAGLFTQHIGTVFDTWSDLPVGGLIINDVPTYRSDAMPYGGVKGSGVGREGVRYAMEEYTDARTLVVRP